MGRGSYRVLEVRKQMEVNGGEKKGLELRMQGKQGQISRVRRLILEAEFWADWSGKEVKGIMRQRLQ